MKLPNVEQIVVEREKIEEYLLNLSHRYGASKARFFAKFGFNMEEWKVLAQALREHGQRHEVRTVWQLDKGAGLSPVFSLKREIPSVFQWFAC